MTHGETNMTITAKFASVCPCCNQRIQIGSKVEWSKGSKARHVACAGSAVAAAPTTYSGRIESSRRAWGARRGMGSGHGQAANVPGYSSYCTDRPGCRCFDCQ